MILPRGVQLPRAEEALNLVARQIYYGRCNPRYQNCRSAFSRWGRWVLAGILIFLGILLLFIVLCCSKRRKRRRALHSTPMTAPVGHNSGYNAGYNNGGGAYNQQYAPPAGAPPPQYGGNAGYNNGYYGQQNGIAQPQNAYVK
ncbi:hypothetical protein BKA64DRAFT_34746 [Cadophora sp. MPI-SDFR-AT-0126]|nr:hypothetical protein BKA64DRAFT_34746 [Leotiomycetes sp. MPI-SDFR-AT-0126]